MCRSLWVPAQHSIRPSSSCCSVETRTYQWRDRRMIRPVMWIYVMEWLENQIKSWSMLAILVAALLCFFFIFSVSLISTLFFFQHTNFRFILSSRFSSYAAWGLLVCLYRLIHGQGEHSIVRFSMMIFDFLQYLGWGTMTYLERKGILTISRSRFQVLTKGSSWTRTGTFLPARFFQRMIQFKVNFSIWSMTVISLRHTIVNGTYSLIHHHIGLTVYLAF